jgi:hypothetical protein
MKSTPARHGQHSPSTSRRPFDRLGVLALIWAALFAAAAVGLTIVMG